MPELPEVEVIRRGITPVVASRVVDDVVVHDVRAVTRATGQTPDVAVIRGMLRGNELCTPKRRGKFLWFPLPSDELCVLVHLGMTGQLRAAGPAPLRHERVRVRYADDGPDLVFADQRLFGYFVVAPLVPSQDGLGDPFDEAAPVALVPEPAAHIARDLLDPYAPREDVVQAIRRRRVAIKRVLLDQGVVSGIGNIYADEALWRAGLHYERRADRLTGPVARDLLGHVTDVMTESLGEGGTSFDATYVNVNGQSGYHAIHLNVYGQQGKTCARCGAVIVREPFMNRSSHRCPRCQRRPRTASTRRP